MFRSPHAKHLLLFCLAVALGAAAVWTWSSQRAYAIGATQSDKVMMCTVPLSEKGDEAVVMLDALTNELKAFQLHPQTGQYNASFFRNLSVDFGLDKIKGAPQFTMVQTNQRFQRRGTAQPIPAAIHIQELTTGKIIAYTLNWNPSRALVRHNVNKPYPIVPLDGLVTRGDIVRNPVSE